ncbi:hypothetical protein [Sutcliffiella halmapala]|uniref:hypothetical protein n=1 Tax=Sutcliffiella halmapala TaxID=79882 RepID=UPI000994CEBF
MIMNLGLIVVCVLIGGCQTFPSETMVLLDAVIEEVNLSESNGVGDINEDILISFTNKESIAFFEEVITTARKQRGESTLSNPDYDVMIQYEETADGGRLPTHGLHIWLGDKDKPSYLMYMMGEEVYSTSAKTTNKLRSYILEEQ